MSASLRECDIACNAPSSTMTRDFCVGLYYSDEQASLCPPGPGQTPTGQKSNCGIVPQQLQFAWLCWSCHDWWHQTCHHFTHVKEMLLLPDSNYIMWASSVPCCFSSRPPASRLGKLHTVPSETKELQNFPLQSALTRVPTTLTFFNGVSEAWSLCALLQPTRLSST